MHMTLRKKPPEEPDSKGTSSSSPFPFYNSVWRWRPEWKTQVQSIYIGHLYVVSPTAINSPESPECPPGFILSIREPWESWEETKPELNEQEPTELFKNK